MNREKWLKEVDERARKRAEEEAEEATKTEAAVGVLARPAAVAVKHWQDDEGEES